MKVSAIACAIGTRTSPQKNSTAIAADTARAPDGAAAPAALGRPPSASGHAIAPSTDADSVRQNSAL